MMGKYKYAVWWVCMCVFGAMHAQTWEMGMGTGLSLYFGDLSVPTLEAYRRNTNVAWTVSVAYRPEEWYALRLRYLHTRLEGDDALARVQWQRQRNLNFFTPIDELSFQMEFDLDGFFNIASPWPFPYLILGAGVLRFDPRTEYKGTVVRLQPLGTEGQGMPGYPEPYKLWTTHMMMGVGYRIALRYDLDLALSVSMRRTNTDYLDDVSGYYVSREELQQFNGEMSAQLGNKIGRETGRLRGGPRIKDWYDVALVELRYRFDTRPYNYRPKKQYYGRCPSKF